MATESSVRAQTFEARPANAFGPYNSVPFAVIDINRATLEELVQHLRVTSSVANRIIAVRETAPITNVERLRTIKGLAATRTFARIKGKVLVAGDLNLHILDITSLSENLFSHRPFTLRVRFANPSDLSVGIVSVTVLWAGEPFVVEKEATN